jgi:hypothetical protein
MAAPARARLVADKRAARCEPVTPRATLGRTDYPTAIGAADQLADCGHDSTVGRLAFAHRPDPADCLMYEIRPPVAGHVRQDFRPDWTLFVEDDEGGYRCPK